MASSEIKSSTIKRSKSLYATAIYGFIVMFIVMVYPFIPLYKEGSLFESGLKMFNANIKGNLIVTISMLIHSIILLVLGIIYVNKLKIHRAGVGYSFYKLFSTTIILAILTYVCFVITGYEQAVYESYGLEYWYVVLGLYLVGLVFSLIAHLTNRELRANKWKVLYLVLSFVAQWGIYLLMLSRNNNVTNGYLYDFVKDEEGFIMSFSQNVAQIKEVQNVYRFAMLIMLAMASISTANLCMPINEPFQFMYNKKCNRTKYSKVSSFATKLRIFLAAVLLLCFIINDGKEEILSTIFIVLITVADFLGARAYNKKVAAKFQPEEVKVENVETEFQEQLVSDVEENIEEDVEEEIELGVEDAYGNVVLWDEERLIAQGENHEFTDKSSICDICSNLQTALKANGINAPLNDVQLAFAAILSSKVIFVRSNANPQMIRRFSETVADFFNGELFFEERKNIYASLDGGEQVELTASDKLTNIKYGMISGLLVSNYLRDLFGLVFVDNSSGADFKASDVTVINALIDNAANAKVGKLVNLPETETYSRGLMQLSDTARLIVFVNETQIKELEGNWIKYSSIVDLNLEEVVEGEEDGDTDGARNVSSYGMIYETLEETEETCFLTEDYWRKLDRLEEFLEENTDIRFDNRFIRQIENNVAAIMSCGMDKMSATDTILATKIIPLVATQKDKIFEAHDQDFSLKLDELFGYENIPCTMAAVANYGLKK